MENFNFPYVDLYTKYEKIVKIGQGTFGYALENFKKESCKISKLVAMKKIPMNYEQNGFPVTALRELRILQALKHQNVVSVIKICRTHPVEKHGSMSTFYLVIEYCDYDLSSLISNSNVQFSLGIIMGILKQILNGLYFIHCNKVLHRNLKPANILINMHGIVKLADFGLSRPFSIHKDGSANTYTLHVVTLWYRALVGRAKREALAPYIQYPLAFELLDKLLMLDPSRRITADDALNHDFSWTDPMPSELNELLRTFVQNRPDNVTSATVSNNQYQDRVY